MTGGDGMRRRIKKKRGFLKDEEYEKLRKEMREGWEEEAKRLEKLSEETKLPGKMVTTQPCISDLRG